MDEIAGVQVKQETSVHLFWDHHGALLVSMLCAIFIALAGYANVRGWGNGEVSCYVVAYLVGGYQKAWEGLQTLIYKHDLDVDLLMVVAAVGAASIGYWQDGAILIFIFSLSGALEGYTLAKTNQDIHSIMQLRPETALVLRDSDEIFIKVEELHQGDRILVKPGERIPADGMIEEGQSAINQASITGESIPIDKVAGNEVFAGTINGQGALIIEVTKPAEATLLAQIIRLVQEAQSERPPSQLFIERFEGIYAKIVIGCAALFMIVLPSLFGWAWEKAIYQAMIFLVVASPCALVSSIMPAVLAGISNGTRKGILFKGGVHLEQMAAIKVVAMDKTGTLTAGEPIVTNIICFTDQSENDLLRFTAALETLSEHPIAKAIVRTAKERDLSLPQATQFQSTPGLGVQGQVNNQIFRLGNSECLEQPLLSIDQQKVIQQLEDEGKTIIYVQANHQLQGVLAIQDSLRPQAREAVAVLRNMGIKVVMLTGDNESTAQAIGKSAGVDEVYAALLPTEKVMMIRKLADKYGKVAMVGDGVNDAPALTAASVGIAMGAIGSDVALETANVVLMADDLLKVSYAIRLGCKTRRVIKQNLTFAMSVIFILVVGTFIGDVNLPFGVIGHEGSTLLVILNGLRLLY